LNLVSRAAAVRCPQLRAIVNGQPPTADPNFHLFVDINFANMHQVQVEREKEKRKKVRLFYVAIHF
jgi:hypothetical protein